MVIYYLGMFYYVPFLILVPVMFCYLYTDIPSLLMGLGAIKPDFGAETAKLQYSLRIHAVCSAPLYSTF